MRGAADRSGRRASRRAQPLPEALDPRLLMASGSVSSADSAELSNSVAAVVQPYLAQNQIPGASVAIVTDGQVALAQGYGLSNVATHSPVQANTQFDIGSVTKTFTAMAVLLLYQDSQGTSRVLNLNAPIKDYLHNTRTFKLPSQWANITPMELLDMTSGIRDVGGSESWQAQLDSIAYDRLLFTPGTESSYSSANYDLLGRAHPAVDRTKLRHVHSEHDPEAAGNVRIPGARSVRDAPEPGNRLQSAQTREVAEGPASERAGNVRGRRNGVDGTGYGHLHDSRPQRPHPGSLDLRAHVFHDSGAAIPDDGHRR